MGVTDYYQHVASKAAGKRVEFPKEEPIYDTIDFPDVTVTETETTEEEVTILRAMIAQQVQNGEIKLTE